MNLGGPLFCQQVHIMHIREPKHQSQTGLQWDSERGVIRRILIDIGDLLVLYVLHWKVNGHSP